MADAPAEAAETSEVSDAAAGLISLDSYANFMSSRKFA